jgi:hypothetical protein
VERRLEHDLLHRLDTLDHRQAVAILERAARQEERHVEFGEQRTMRVVDGRPWLRRRLLGLTLAQHRLLAREAGFDDHLVKPIDLTLLRARLARI